MRYVGCYFPDADLSVASTVGNFVILNPVTLLHTPGMLDAFARTDLKVMLQWHIGTQDMLLDVDGQCTTQLVNVRNHLAQVGLLDRVLAILPHEEWYGRLVSGGMADWPAVRDLGQQPGSTRLLSTALCGALDRLTRTIRRVFPQALVGHVEPWWEDDPRDEAMYRPVPRSYDFLGVDAYVDGAITREKWDQIVNRAYAGASRYGKPILMVPQTFADGVDPWRDMPTVAQLGWWATLPIRYPLIAGCAYFCLDHPGQYDPVHPPGRGLTQYPDRLAAVQAYWRRQS